MNSYYVCIDGGQSSVLFAVCRGKVSEGINFSDTYCRAIVIVGIPFPSTVDRQIALKKEFQNKASLSNPVLVNGNTWYNQQAFRAINQAVGRCF